MPDWNKIKKEYVRGGISQRKLAEKYGVSYSELAKKAMREKWADKRNQVGIKAESKMLDQVAEQNARTNEDFFSLVDQLVSLTASAMAKTAASGKESPSAVEHYANAIATIQKIKGIKSSLDESEQKARIDKLRKDIEAGKDDTEKVVISLEGVEAWAK